jgi:hypothetical protein
VKLLVILAIPNSVSGQTGSLSCSEVLPMETSSAGIAPDCGVVLLLAPAVAIGWADTHSNESDDGQSRQTGRAQTKKSYEPNAPICCPVGNLEVGNR